MAKDQEEGRESAGRTIPISNLYNVNICYVYIV